MDFANFQFELSEIQSDGSTLLDHLKSIQKQTKKVPDKLKHIPILPVQCAHLWEWYKALDEGRTNNGFSQNPITWMDIYAWTELTHNYPTVWEVRLLRSLDRIHRNFLNKKKAKK